MGLMGIFALNLICSLPPYCIPSRAPPQAHISSNTNVTHPIVNTEGGLIQGFSMGTMQGRQIYGFQGIPFGEKPQMFKEPLPKKPWKGIKTAFKHGPPCLQIHPIAIIFRVIGELDCLTLDVYTPKIPKSGNDTLLPILLYIHGGCFVFGTSQEIGHAYLLDHDVILVTIQYRLGPLGFLSTGDMASAGNWGLKDQQLAIKWVHSNIAKFGGDPTKITLMGQSAGGVSTHLHLLSKKSQDLVQGGVSLSGSAFNHWGIRSPDKGRDLTVRLAKILGCPSEESYAMVECLKSIDPVILVSKTVWLFNWAPFPPVFFAPVVEPANSTDAFITESPDELYAKGKVPPKPWIGTLTLEEGYTAINFMKVFLRWTQFRLRMEANLPIALDFFGHPKSSEISHKIYNFYSNGEKNPLKIPEGAISDMIMDRYFSNGMSNALKAHSSVAPTYSYLFSYNGKYNQGTLFGIPRENWGIGHTEDIFYFFNSSYLSDGFKKDDKEYELGQILTNLLVNFMKKGIPYYTDNITRADSVIWDRIESDGRSESPLKFLQVDTDIKMIDDPLKERLNFWKELMQKFDIDDRLKDI